jgi:aldehyde:ferredoxin oxidoreductase
MPSPRFYEEAPKTGATKGQITRFEDVHKLLDMYYEQRGWTSDGIPTAATLEQLGLAELVA